LFERAWQSKIFPKRTGGLVYPGDPGVRAGLIPTEKGSVRAPCRLGLGSRGNGRSLVRAAYGIFNDPYYTGQGGPLQTPKQCTAVFADSAAWFSGGKFFRIVRRETNPFAGSGFAQPMTLLTLEKNLRLPYRRIGNLGVQQSFGADWLWKWATWAAKGTQLPRFVEGNPAVLGPVPRKTM